MGKIEVLEIDDNGDYAPMVARYIPTGGAYGAGGTLTADQPMVEFYDTRHPHTEYGQFVARYNVATFVEGSDTFVPMALHAGVGGWALTGYARAVIGESVRTLAELERLGIG